MEIIVFLSIVIAVVAVLTSIVLVRRVKKQLFLFRLSKNNN